MSEAGRATVAPYAAAKGGMKLLTRAMAAEWAAHGIQANAVGPGFMVTERSAPPANDEEFDAWVKAARRTDAGASRRSSSAPRSS
jgi:gluconate 5-dehydrogenase